MRDVEDRLRALGQATEGDFRGGLSPSADSLRRVRIRRVISVSIALFSLVVALGSGILYVSDVLRTDNQVVSPPEKKKSTGFGRFFPAFSRDEEAVIELDAGDETVCYSLDSIQGYASFTRAAIVRGQVHRSSAIELFPNENAFTPKGGGDCVRNADGSTLEEIIDHPSQFFLLVESPGDGELVASLQQQRQRGNPLAPDLLTLWPEDTAEAVKLACSEVNDHRSSWRLKAPATAIEFGREVLGWDDPLAKVLERSRNGWDIELRESRSNSGAKEAAAIVYTLDTFGACWSVGSVSLAPDREVDLSVSVNGSTANIFFDDLGAQSATIEFGYGGRVATKTWQQGMKRPVLLRLGFKPDTTGHFLILFRDANGAVFAAKGGPLPKGNFAAG